MKELAQSKTYRVSHEYEAVFLLRAGKPPIDVGDFYGDPKCAVISPGETWCAIGGCGLIIYFIRKPFEPYQYDHATSQWMEFGREPKDNWWITSLTAKSETQLLFTTDPAGNHPGTYTLDVQTGRVERK